MAQREFGGEAVATPTCLGIERMRQVEMEIALQFLETVARKSG
jgi:hypothetical protein